MSGLFAQLWQRVMRPEQVREAAGRTSLLAAVLDHRRTLRAQGDDALSRAAMALRHAAIAGSPVDEQARDGLALAAEIARRRLGMDPFDVQLEAAVALHRGHVIEMGTGEGKTLAAALATCVNALSGEGVHVLTANDYLAARDAEWMRPLHAAFGLEVAAIGAATSRDERRRAYAADITHATANEVGFDYLRDHLALDPGDLVQRPFGMALVDEADSVLLDEARIPLVIAGGVDAPAALALDAAALARRMKPGVDFIVDGARRNVELTTSGAGMAEARFGVESLYDGAGVDHLAAVNVALHAESLLHRDVDYIVEEGAIQLVDELKGRIADRRRWPDGMHAALEAKERLALTREGRVLATLTVENLVAMYPRLCGMTGTAHTAMGELEASYRIEIVDIAPRVPSRREDLPDVVFATAAEKGEALLREIERLHAARRPVLVGTSSVGESEALATGLHARGVTCVVLNARHPEDEAAVIACAGDLDAVTISTNMAGRGTDICLGGPDGARADDVRSLGGLFVIGTRRHDSRRIDDQLRGRAGRQGDPGQTRFFLALDDELLARRDETASFPIGTTEDPRVSEAIAHLQRTVEGESHQIRTTLAKYALLLETQRRLLHGRREAWLAGEEVPLSEEALARGEELDSTLGQGPVDRAARHITLSIADRLWAEHLALAADVREGIHLRSLGMQKPLVEYNAILHEAFTGLESDLAEQASEAFLRARIGPDGVDLDAEGLAGPTATWTYLVTDEPFGSIAERLASGLARKVGLKKDTATGFEP